MLLTLALRPRAWNTPAGWFALLLLAFSLNCRVQIGVRFMFTLMAVAYVCCRGGRESRGGCGAVGRRRWSRSRPGVSALAWPHGLGYFNRLWGDPAHGYTRLHDSNYDWGQGAAGAEGVERGPRRRPAAGRVVLRHRPRHPLPAVPVRAGRPRER